MQESKIWKVQQVLTDWILLKKTDLANLKYNVDKLDIDKLQNVPNNFNNLYVMTIYIYIIQHIYIYIYYVYVYAYIYIYIYIKPDITNLATITDFTAVEKKITSVSNLVKILTMAQALGKLKIKLLLIMIMINILQLENLIR